MSVTIRKRSLPSGKIELRLDVYQFGKRHFESLGLYLNGDKFHNKEVLKIAEVLRARKELELQSAVHGIIPQTKRKESFCSYVESIGKQKQSIQTQRNYENALKHLITFAKGTVYFPELTKPFFEGFRDYLLNTLSHNSAWKYLAVVKSAVSSAVREGIIHTNPAFEVRIKKVDTLPKFLTLDEVRAMAITPCENKSVRNAFLFSCFSGLRYSDVVKLSWNEIEEGFLTFTQKKTKMQERVFLSKQAQKILEEQKGIGKSERIEKVYPQKTIFFLPRGSTVNTALQRWATRAGISKSISFHCARHTFATLSLTSGIDIYTTSKLLGHRNLQTTLIYAKVIDEKKQQAVNLLPSL